MDEGILESNLTRANCTPCSYRTVTDGDVEPQGPPVHGGKPRRIARNPKISKGTVHLPHGMEYSTLYVQPMVHMLGAATATGTLGVHRKLPSRCIQSYTEGQTVDAAPLGVRRTEAGQAGVDTVCAIRSTHKAGIVIVRRILYRPTNVFVKICGVLSGKASICAHFPGSFDPGKSSSEMLIRPGKSVAGTGWPAGSGQVRRTEVLCTASPTSPRHLPGSGRHNGRHPPGGKG